MGKLQCAETLALQDCAEQSALIACVAQPDRQQQLQQQIQRHQITAHWLRSPAQGLGISNSYAEPQKWGVDRWLALAAGYARTQSACCVIDVGTAITVDMCDAQGHHLGGLIAPGLNALHRALRSSTALPQVAVEQLVQAGQWLSQNTEDALRSGAVQSACGLIDRCAQLARTQHDCQHIILTGGHAPALQAHLQVQCLLN